MKTTAFFFSMLMTMLPSGVVSGQQKPTTGYAPVNGLKMYYVIHGSGEPVVLLHGAFMTISNNWTASWGNASTDWIAELSKTRKVIAVEMQGHGRTADIKRDLTYENLELPGSDWDLNFSEQDAKTTVSISIYNESLERLERMIEGGMREGTEMQLKGLEDLLAKLSREKESK